MRSRDRGILESKDVRRLCSVMFGYAYVSADREAVLYRLTKVLAEMGILKQAVTKINSRWKCLRCQLLMMERSLDCVLVFELADCGGRELRFWLNLL